MQYDQAAAPLLPPLVAFARREDYGDVITFTTGVQLDDETKAALAKDMIDEMSRRGRTQAWRAFGQ